MNRHSIRWRFLLTMLGLIIALLATLTYVQIRSQQDVLERELDRRETLMREKTLQRGKTLSDNLSNQVSIEIAAFNFSKLSELIKDAVKEDPELTYGILMDVDSMVHLHTLQPELEYAILSAPEDLFALKQEHATQQTFEREGEEIVEFINPIPLGLEPWGVLRLGFSMAKVATEIEQSRQEINAQIQTMIMKSVITAIIFLFVGFVIIFIITTRISKPLVELTDAAHELAMGNFATKIPVHTDYQDEINVLATAFADMVTNLKRSYTQLEQYNKAYERFVPREFLRQLDKQSVIDVQLGDQVEKKMSILFSDIRNFTSHSERMTPQDNFNFINAYLSRMAPIIDQHRGFIDKYIGDAIMALFPISADDAVRAAIGMLKQLAEYNLTRGRPERPHIRIGLGIHTGYLMLGTVGEETRMDGTVISDAVNLASRIESLTKNYGTPLLITEQTCQQLADVSQYKIRLIDHVTVKGKTEPVRVYEVFDADEPTLVEAKLKTLTDFEQGFKCFHQEQFEQAKDFFEAVLQVNHNDKVAQIYFSHCQKVLNMMSGIPKILVVDDTPFNVKVLFHLLRSKNFEVLVAQDGETAIEIAKSEHPHLILLDVMMPNLNGFETCQRLKEDPVIQDIPVIFITALSDTVSKVKGFKSGAVDYITKPFQNEEVIARVKTHLSINYLQQQLQAKNVELDINNLKLKEKINNLTQQHHI